jgi:hypothetical protein
MTSNGNLRQTLFAEIEKRRIRAENRSKVLGAFVEATLTNSGRSRADFAKAMDMDDDLADALLDGQLPESIISDRTLLAIAEVIQYDPNVMRAIMGRSIDVKHKHAET